MMSTLSMIVKTSHMMSTFVNGCEDFLHDVYYVNDCEDFLHDVNDCKDFLHDVYFVMIVKTSYMMSTLSMIVKTSYMMST